MYSGNNSYIKEVYNNDLDTIDMINTFNLPFVKSNTENTFENIENQTFNYFKEKPVENEINNNLDEESVVNINTFHFKYEYTDNERTVSYLSHISERSFFDFSEVESSEEKEKKPLTERKMADDSIRKRLKTKLEAAILLKINSHLASKYKNENFKFKKLPEKFLKDVTIGRNKKWLEMTLEERLQHNFEGKINKKTMYNIDLIRELKNKHPEEFSEDSLLKMKWKELIIQYFKSNKYKHDLITIKEKEGVVYADIINKLALGDKNHPGFLEYFKNTNANKSYKKKGKFVVNKIEQI